MVCPPSFCFLTVNAEHRQVEDLILLISSKDKYCVGPSNPTLRIYVTHSYLRSVYLLYLKCNV